MSSVQEIRIQEILTKHLRECVNFANRNNYVSTQNLEAINDGAYFYEVNLNNEMVSRKRVKTGTTIPLASHSLYIVTNDDLGPDSILESLIAPPPPPVTGGKRKSRRNRKKRKSRKNRRKSNRRRR